MRMTLNGLLNPCLALCVCTMMAAEPGIQPLAGSATPGATPAPPKEWALRDPSQGAEGDATAKAYAELALVPPAEPVVVAVIDSGIDGGHPDLAPVIWTNPKEATGLPGMDDDGNGSVDDLHGWNFLGSRDGSREVGPAPMEFMRVTAMYASTTRALSPEEAAERGAALTMMEQHRRMVMLEAMGLAMWVERFDRMLTSLTELGIHDNTTTAFAVVPATTPVVVTAQRVLGREFARGMPFANLRERMANRAVSASAAARAKLDNAKDIHDLVGDDPTNLEERGYGNPFPLKSRPDALHGTHVAGIIGAVRGNGRGIDGHAQWVRIMALRAVPDGDERDKDVANALRYAVDNGARIINCSFGKPFSPGKRVVDAALAHAADKGVLVVIAAGNDALDLDQTPTYPNRIPKDTQNDPFANVLVIGASTRNRNLLAAVFSNYGQTQVDLFAPGQDIISTVPGEGTGELSGTSMAAPAVSGVAALVLSQYPKLTARGLRAVLMHTSRRYPGLTVKRPGSTVQVPFASLSVSGGVLDAYASLVYLRDHGGVAPPEIAPVRRQTTVRKPNSGTAAASP